MKSKTFVLEVWGEFACFSRPEMKVERFSYPLPPPSAVRGMYDAIYSKPQEFRWQPEKVEVLSEPSYIALRRNEVKDKISVRAVERWARGEGQPVPIWADGDSDFLGTDQKGRTQRQTMALRNVRYRLHASMLPWPGFEGHVPALEAQFGRRAASGKCFYQPYLGCREFAAYFEPRGPGEGQAPTDWSAELGLMLYDVFDLSRPGKPDDAASISLFRAKVDRGVMTVPSYSEASVIKLPAGGL
ncbi:MAG: type I-C CRISPR-associated protein Cas5 [Bryobacterales bacterium]|nr:type I-C CRISPR-associated protein Cas5 [Bryobacterales bacterium]